MRQETIDETNKKQMKRKGKQRMKIQGETNKR